MHYPDWESRREAIRKAFNGYTSAQPNANGQPSTGFFRGFDGLINTGYGSPPQPQPLPQPESIPSINWAQLIEDVQADLYDMEKAGNLRDAEALRALLEEYKEKARKAGYAV